MPAPLYTIPGTAAATATAPQEAAAAPRTVAEVLARTQVEAVLDELERDLIGLAPVKQRLREIAALLVIDRLRAQVGLASQAPSLHIDRKSTRLNSSHH